MINGVNQADLAQSVAEISGETQAVVGGVATYLRTRSAKDPFVTVAEQYFYEHLQSYGLDSVTYQSYPGTGVVPPGRNVIGQINGTTKAIEDDVSQVDPNWEQLTDRVTTPGWQWDYYVRNTQSLVAAAAHLAGIQ